jgi:hypothetical protein
VAVAFAPVRRLGCGGLRRCLAARGLARRGITRRFRLRQGFGGQVRVGLDSVTGAAQPRWARTLPRILHLPFAIRNPPSRLRRYGGQVHKRQARLNNLELGTLNLELPFVGSDNLPDCLPFASRTLQVGADETMRPGRGSAYVPSACASGGREGRRCSVS